jgi:ASTRA-associated protein 1
MKEKNSHGRDNSLRVWQIPTSSDSTFSTVLPAEDVSTPRKQPWLLHSLTVNALNFCSFSTCAADPSDSSSSPPDSILVAVPGTREGHVDIHALPSEQRRYAVPPSTALTPSMLMALHLFRPQTALHLVAAGESGATTIQSFAPASNSWSTIYAAHPHSQPVLSLDVAPTLGRYFTSSADAVVASHPLPSGAVGGAALDKDDMRIVKTGHAGQQSLTVRSDSRVFATAGWDSRVRVYSARTMKEVAVLKWHKEGCYAVAFAEVLDAGTAGERVDEAGDAEAGGQGRFERSVVKMDAGDVVTSPTSLPTARQRREQKTQETHWLAAGSKDGKISLWIIY